MSSGWLYARTGCGDSLTSTLQSTLWPSLMRQDPSERTTALRSQNAYATGCNVTADRQVKQGNMCFVVTGSTIAASDCDEAAAVGGDKFFQVAVPASNPTGPMAVQAMGELLRPSSKRQRALLGALQSLLPKLASCKVGSFAKVESPYRAWSRPALVSKHHSTKSQHASERDYALTRTSLSWREPLSKPLVR